MKPLPAELRHTEGAAIHGCFPDPAFSWFRKSWNATWHFGKVEGKSLLLNWAGLFFISKLRQREKKHGTVSDPALPWGYEQEPSKTGIECAWERSLEWTSVVSQGAGTRGWQEGGWNQWARLKASLLWLRERTENSSFCSSQYINLLEMVNGNLEIRSHAQGVRRCSSGWWRWLCLGSLVSKVSHWVTRSCIAVYINPPL